MGSRSIVSSFRVLLAFSLALALWVPFVTATGASAQEGDAVIDAPKLSSVTPVYPRRVPFQGWFGLRVEYTSNHNDLEMTVKISGPGFKDEVVSSRIDQVGSGNIYRGYLMLPSETKGVAEVDSIQLKNSSGYRVTYYRDGTDPLVEKRGEWSNYYNTGETIEDPTIDWSELYLIVDPAVDPTESGPPDFVPPDVSPFVDVDKDQLFYMQMAWMYERGISVGWQNLQGAREYRPLVPINRDAMAAFLYRMAGSPKYTPPSQSPFADVSTTQHFYKEISWLYDQGISTGWVMPDGTREYRPLSPINRDAMAAFMFRMAGSPEYYVPNWRSPFADVGVRHQFYREISWAHSVGITQGWHLGTEQRKYRPSTPINRDAMAKFLFELQPYVDIA